MTQLLPALNPCSNSTCFLVDKDCCFYHLNKDQISLIVLGYTRRYIGHKLRIRDIAGIIQNLFGTNTKCTISPRYPRAVKTSSAPATTETQKTETTRTASTGKSDVDRIPHPWRLIIFNNELSTILNNKNESWLKQRKN